MTLKSVDDYNREKRQERKEREEKARKTGVACPKCGRELLWADLGLSSYAFSSSGLNREAFCPDCQLQIPLEA